MDGTIPFFVEFPEKQSSKKSGIPAALFQTNIFRNESFPARI